MTTVEAFLSISKTRKILQVLNYFLWTDIPTIITAALWKLYKSKNKIKYLDKSDNVAVVTGAEKNTDVYVIKELARAGFTVIVGTKNPEDCERLQNLIENEALPGKIELLPLNLGSLKSVQQFVDAIDKKNPFVSLLVNNFQKPYNEFSVTEDGFESNLAMNYLGHFYLTHLLLKNMKYSGENCKLFSRVVNVISPEFYGARINFVDLNNKQGYDSRAAIGQAKLAVLMMTKCLENKMDYYHFPIKFYAVNSGEVSNSQRSTKNSFTSWILSHLQIKPSDSAESILYACFSENLELFGGHYLSNCFNSCPSLYSCNQEHQEKLYNATLEVLGLNVFGTKSAKVVPRRYHELSP